jgi:hypothetical protein
MTNKDIHMKYIITMNFFIVYDILCNNEYYLIVIVWRIRVTPRIHSM